MIRRLRSAVLALLLLAAAPPALAGQEGEWRQVLTVRFGNVDAIDAADGDLAAFLRGIRNDGRFPPPMRTLVGPEIRNPTFFGLVQEAWMECLVLAPVRPGPLAALWVFPVDSRDEYMFQLAGQGLSEYEGMDGATVLRETDPDGNAREWHMDWLPGDIAVFGADRAAVAAARSLYAENSASHGLLASVGGRFVEADVTLRFEPARLAAWQPAEAGNYWWRTQALAIAADLLGYWRPGQARARLAGGLAENLAAWPRLLGRVQASVWFERQGVEFRLEAGGDFRPAPPPSELDIVRRLPERTAAAWAVPVTPGSFTSFGEFAGRLLLGAAGGAATTEARAAAANLFSFLEIASPRQALAAWVAPPANRPEAGAVRLLVMEWAEPTHLKAAWDAFLAALEPGTPTAQALSQLGWAVELRQDAADPMQVEVVVSPPGDGRRDEIRDSRLAAYRADLAAAAAAGGTDGPPAVREAFTRMGTGGAAFIGLFDPVRFFQLALAEAADWRPRTPDQPDSTSAKLAREMLEYDSGGAWSMIGESDNDAWRFVGGMSWGSLARLSAALGITEAIGMAE